MNRKIIGIGILIGVFLIGIVSASFLTYFGKITGTATVNAPVFYLDGHLDGVYHKLLVNEIPSSNYTINWSDGNRIVFETNNLNVSYFYPIELHAHIWMKTNNSGNTIQARFIKLDENHVEQTICDVANPITITSVENFIEKEFSCNSSGQIDLSSYNKIGLEMWGN